MTLFISTNDLKDYAKFFAKRNMLGSSYISGWCIIGQRLNLEVQFANMTIAFADYLEEIEVWADLNNISLEVVG